MSKTLFKNAKAIVTVDDSNRVLANANLCIHGNIIDYIGYEDVSADRTIDASRLILYPGLINTHHHFYQTFTRNLPQVQNLELFPWLKALYEIWRYLDEESIYYSSLTAMGELLRYGCTTVMDHHYVFPKEHSGNFIDRQFDAAEALGIRLHATRGSMSRGKSEGGLPPDDLVQDITTILEDSERLVNKFHDPSPFSMRQIALAPCSPFSVTTDLLKESARLARKLGVRLHTHLCETHDEEQFCLDLFGQRPLDYMESCEWTGNDVWYAHGIHFDDEELERLAKTGTGVAHCPVSNMKLSSGVCRVPEMLELGVPLGLGVDGSASNDCSNLMAEIRAAYLLHRLTWSDKAPTGYDMLKIATRGSAGILGRDDIGSLEEGKAADFFAVEASSLEFVCSEKDAANLLGTVGVSKPAHFVYVNGNLVAEKGFLLGIDEEKTARAARRKVDSILQRAGL
ncbi:MAG TPA: 8-oxoguanine deaminase [Bacillota bacterium]|nr:8-oxoguanine deaminase [Bacillota bacterium]